MEPKVKFKGFEGEWKETTLSDICIVNPKAELPHSFEYVDLESVLGTNLISHRTEYKETSPSRAQRVAEFGDIFFQSVRPYQRNNYLFTKNDGNYVFSSGYVQLRTFEDNGFIFAIIQTDSFVDKVLCKCTGSSYPTISSKDLSHIPFRITKSKEEQHAIASYFRTLDAKIQASAKKVESLKKLKSASLVVMFPQNGESTPKVRCKGFEGEWTTSNLGSIFAERIESNENGEMLSVTMNNGIIKSSDNGRFDNSNSDKSKYKVVKVGDIAYNSMRMWQGASGVSPYEGIVSPAYTVVTPCADVDTDFFGYLFKTDDVIRLFKLHSQGLTSDNWNLKYPAFSRLCVSYPKSKEEQQAIATFFRSLDRKIALETARLEKLKQIKLACLDKMFV